jgi:hypothetical protein
MGDGKVRDLPSHGYSRPDRNDRVLTRIGVYHNSFCPSRSLHNKIAKERICTIAD